MFNSRKQINKVFSALLLSLIAFSLVFAISGAAWAGETAGTGMPWEEGLNRLRDSITGPVAMAISLIAIVAAGAALIFGGDMTGFMRTTVYIVLVLGIVMSASNLLTALFDNSALVPFLY
ncbi:MAG: TrbC/VirB2 family protein [Synergistaceae bacterium]|nr:TrbC/VirB2 family protein [Synergistaceae bacterium]